MRFTVRYIPLSQIKPGLPVGMTARLRYLRHLMWDGLHLIVVQRDRKDGQYRILLGNDRYEYLRNHTKKLTAPCIVNESKLVAGLQNWLQRFSRKPPAAEPASSAFKRLTPSSWAIMRAYLKEDHRFKQLSRRQQAQVLLLAVRHKQMVVSAMKSKTDQLLDTQINGKG
ncbi:hypothetical protein [Paenibacillus sp. CF384]|uniref:hypothetical protein n=1 Tax=Paenibacillus sp. CF384 TaxID=1884382 RepID=UPI00089B5940|nr:hypothetical protein [Paenibacillus sp. CF384]SDW20929.1 hypothetical protein SAMN05518855_1001663 [Paenibacillus sp. CF384]